MAGLVPAIHVFALSGLPAGDAAFCEVLLQLARLEHLADDVAAADEFALDVELRDGRPVGVFLDALAELVGVEHVDALVVDAEVVEDADHLGREAAHRKLRRALHEQHDVVRLHLAVDPTLDVAHTPDLLYASGAAVCRASAWS